MGLAADHDAARLGQIDLVHRHTAREQRGPGRDAVAGQRLERLAGRERRCCGLGMRTTESCNDEET